MATKTLTKPSPATIAATAKKNAGIVKKLQGVHKHPAESIRETTYNGHRIVVRTSYKIEVDGKPVLGHLGVTDDGQVHYHPIPNIALPSALDMVKRIIDVFPDEFPKGKGSKGGRAQGGHSHGRKGK